MAAQSGTTPDAMFKQPYVIKTQQGPALCVPKSYLEHVSQRAYADSLEGRREACEAELKRNEEGKAACEKRKAFFHDIDKKQEEEKHEIEEKARREIARKAREKGHIMCMERDDEDIRKMNKKIADAQCLLYQAKQIQHKIEKKKQLHIDALKQDAEVEAYRQQQLALSEEEERRRREKMIKGRDDILKQIVEKRQRKERERLRKEPVDRAGLEKEEIKEKLMNKKKVIYEQLLKELPNALQMYKSPVSQKTK